MSQSRPDPRAFPTRHSVISPRRAIKSLFEALGIGDWGMFGFRRNMIAALGLATALSGCGGSGTSPTVEFENLLPADAASRGDARVDLPETPVYNLLDGGVAGVTVLEGVGTLGLFTPSAAEVGEGRYYFYGTRDAGTGTITVTDTTNTLLDTDGFQSSGTTLIVAPDAPQPDPSLRQLTLRQTDFSGDPSDQSAFTRRFRASYNDEDGAAFFVEGVFGVATLSNEMPVSGSAVMTGSGTMTIGTNLIGNTRFGTSQVTADFTNGLVNITYNTDPMFANLEVDGVSAVGMTITDNSFSGGTLSMTKDGSDVTETALGALEGQDAAGLFFGPAAGGLPEEVGGVVEFVGDGKSLRLIFAAK